MVLVTYYLVGDRLVSVNGVSSPNLGVRKRIGIWKVYYVRGRHVTLRGEPGYLNSGYRCSF